MALVAGIIFTLVWRVDNAVISLPSVMACLLIWAVVRNQMATLGRYTMKAAVIVVVPVAIVVAVLISLGYPLADNFRDALGYVGGSQAHGLPEILNGGVFAINLPNFILPAAAILLAIATGIRSFQRSVSFRDLIIVAFFTTAYVLNFQRGLVRHAPGIEGSDNFISSVVYFLIPFQILVLAKVRICRIWIFALAGYLFIMAFKTPQPRETNIYLISALEVPADIRYADSTDAASRVPAYREYVSRFNGLDSLLKMNFPRTASFIDLSNTPMLYYYLQREVPGYFSQYTQNMVTGPIQERNVKRLQGLDLPLVVFSSWPAHNFFDRTDGVENTIRYHKLSAYVFENYKPLGVVSGKFIWLKHGLGLRFNNTEPVPDSVYSAVQAFGLQKLPYLWAKGKASRTRGLLLSKTGADSWQLPAGLRRKGDNFVILQVSNSSHEPRTLRLVYFALGKEQGSFDFWISGEDRSAYLVPVSTQYNWYSKQVDSIVVQRPVPDLSVDKLSLHEEL
ncbi:MAG: hypothetical protein EOP49_03900 [Sphingobacteriales bacterium]|nr:MAG: hypothetical protein EOP49_03900 [Sphingobacteriales bacterium]